VKPWELLGQTRAPDGSEISLTKRDREFVILANGKSLMSSRMHGSEEALASLGCRKLATAQEPRVLVGGLGMGFTLRAALDLLPPDAIVIVAELIPAVVEWNRGPLGALANHPLDDRRVRVSAGDVLLAMRERGGVFDAILLDVDNGPVAFSTQGNSGLYGDAGIAAARFALKPDGVLTIWSAWEDRKFEQRLRYAGFTVEVQRVRARLKQGGPRHTIFIGRKGGAWSNTRSPRSDG
jgi:spermidine synthase